MGYCNQVGVDAAVEAMAARMILALTSYDNAEVRGRIVEEVMGAALKPAGEGAVCISTKFFWGINDPNERTH